MQKYVDHGDVIGAALLQLYLQFRPNTWLQLIAQKQLQDEMRNF